MPRNRMLEEVQKVRAYGLGGVFRQAERAFALAFQRTLAAHGLTPAQWTHLRALWEEDGLTQVELCRRINIKKASSTSVLNGLESMGLVRRERNGGDRRKLNIFLTPEGRRLRRMMVPYANHINEQARRGLSEAELQTLLRLLHRVIANLVDEEPAEARTERAVATVE